MAVQPQIRYISQQHAKEIAALLAMRDSIGSESSPLPTGAARSIVSSHLSEALVELVTMAAKISREDSDAYHIEHAPDEEGGFNVREGFYGTTYRLRAVDMGEVVTREYMNFICNLSNQVKSLSKMALPVHFDAAGLRASLLAAQINAVANILRINNTNAIHAVTCDAAQRMITVVIKRGEAVHQVATISAT